MNIYLNDFIFLPPINSHWSTKGRIISSVTSLLLHDLFNAFDILHLEIKYNHKGVWGINVCVRACACDCAADCEMYQSSPPWSAAAWFLLWGFFLQHQASLFLSCLLSQLLYRPWSNTHQINAWLCTESHFPHAEDDNAQDRQQPNPHNTNNSFYIKVCMSYLASVSIDRVTLSPVAALHSIKSMPYPCKSDINNSIVFMMNYLNPALVHTSISAPATKL